jgi:hypothetical protein
MADNQKIEEAVQLESRTYQILSGFIFKHCIHRAGTLAQFSERDAAQLAERGLIKILPTVE